ncbi:sensor histidine kinase [Rugosimonospora africana]|uniref:histidine kinase n=1 Tax=Rugosimonospora africana TaxID=556532 RepID=A0A8J3VRA1_9ACTN|nr:sensor histidine kinase [Rugosimonospora africana]GIH15970.1 two-component sensor histidine kinase [Rugosimonospora africana]
MDGVGVAGPGRSVFGVLAECGLAAVVALAIGMRIFVSAEPGAPPGAPAYLFAVLIAALLPLRGRTPLGVLLASIILLVIYHAVGNPGISPVIPLAVPLYAAAVAGHLRWAVSAAILAMTTAELFTVFQDHLGVTVSAIQLLPQAALLGSLVLLGETIRGRRALAREADSAARYAVLDREREADRRVTEERLRIARELHDVLAHTLAGAAIQASVAADTLTDDPATTLQAVEAVRASCREARAELAATVGVLRAAPLADRRRTADRAPMPGLAQLDSLIETARRAGLQVDLTRQGEPYLLPPAVDLTAYRILQESLTNVVQHAAARAVSVDLAYRPAEIVVSVLDDGRGTNVRRPHQSTPEGGFGILGMRERAAAVGGQLFAGDRSGGGFQVVAALPIGMDTGTGR